MKKKILPAVALLVSLALLIALPGCSAPSQPSAPEPPEPAAVEPETAEGQNSDTGETNEKWQDRPTILYQGHASLRITTTEGKVIYVDPYAGEGYDLPADIILVTHQHSDHNKVKLIKSKNPGCVTITEKEALKDGELQTFELGYDSVEAVLAYNKNHDIEKCVGYIISLIGLKIYISGDTSTTTQMETFADRDIDYAFLCCDGVYNMDTTEASECAALIGARFSIPYHMAPGRLYDYEIAKQFEAEGRLFVEAGEEIVLEYLGC